MRHENAALPMSSDNLNPMNSLKVSEAFYSVQGEGKTTGCPAIFIRLTACNLLCKGDGWICDSIDVWKKGKRYSFEEVTQLVPDFYEKLEQGAHLIFTGGEPMLQQTSIARFLQEQFWLADRPHPFVEIETNATVYPSSALKGLVHLWNLSPKLKTSGAKDNRYNYEVLSKLARNLGPQEAQWKFVVSDIDRDIHDIHNNFVNKFELKPRQVVLMPATDGAELDNKFNRSLVEVCKHFGYWYSNRLQIQVFGALTGV